MTSPDESFLGYTPNPLWLQAIADIIDKGVDEVNDRFLQEKIIKSSHLEGIPLKLAFKADDEKTKKLTRLMQNLKDMFEDLGEWIIVADQYLISLWPMFFAIVGVLTGFFLGSRLMYDSRFRFYFKMKRRPLKNHWSTWPTHSSVVIIIFTRVLHLIGRTHFSKYRKSLKQTSCENLITSGGTVGLAEGIVDDMSCFQLSWTDFKDVYHLFS